MFVLQGLGGLGKSTLAFHLLPLLGPKESHCPLWCQDAEKHTEGADPIAEALVGQLSEFGRQRFGLDWEGVVQQVDRAAGDDPARRFASFLEALLANVPRLVIYLDNLESLLIGPKDPRERRPGRLRHLAFAGAGGDLVDPPGLRRGDRHALHRRELSLPEQ